MASGTPLTLEHVRPRAASTAATAEERFEAARRRHRTIDTVLGIGERDRQRAGSLLAGALAFRLFTVLAPLMVVVVALVGVGAAATDSTTTDLVKRLGITGYLADSVSQTAELSLWDRVAALLVGGFAPLWAALVTRRALRAAHAVAWGIPLRRFRRAAGGALAFVGFLAVVSFLEVLVTYLSGVSVGLAVAATLASAAAYAVTWLAASSLLPHRGTGWVPLLPGAAPVGAGVVVMKVVTIYSVWRVMPASSFYAPAGLTIVLLAWLYLLARLMMASATVNAYFWERQERRILAHRQEPARLAGGRHPGEG